jgi:hypothetical protein
MDVEVFVLVDADGQSWVSNDADTLDEDNEAVKPSRMFKLTLNVPVPSMVELSATIPAELIPEKPVVLTVPV